MRPALDVTPKPAKPWITRSSILILSGILIGMGLQLPMSTALHKSILAAGTVGLLSFLVLEGAAKLNARIARERALARLDWTLQVRIHKHIPQRRPHAMIPDVIPMRDASYLTVSSTRGK